MAAQVATCRPSTSPGSWRHLRRGVDPRAVPIDDAKRQLKAIGAIVP